MRADLKVIGPAAIWPRYLVAGGTSIQAGEPVHSVATSSGGVATANTFVLAAADTPTIGTHRFGGVANENSQNNSAATPVVIEQFLNCAIPVPNVGRLRGAAQTAASVDTLTELALIIGDFTLIDYNATGASDGGQLYTIIEVAVADTAGLEIVGGNTALSTLDAVVDARAYRLDVT